MKAILILCTCIAFCRLASTMSTTDDARAAHRMKLYTRYVGEIQNDMQKKIDELSGHDMLKILKVQYLWTLSQRIMLNNLNLKISKALDDTRKYIHSITGKTINLEYCNDEQRKAFEALQNRALLMYYKCEETGIAQLTMPSADMRKIAEQGNRIVEKLDTMISSCMLSNSPVMQESCTIATISEIEPLVQAFSTKYESARHVLVNEYELISQNFDDCSERQIRPVDQEIPEITAATSKCVHEDN